MRILLLDRGDSRKHEAQPNKVMRERNMLEHFNQLARVLLWAVATEPYMAYMALNTVQTVAGSYVKEV